MATLSNLYPPIVDTFMPAFLIGSERPEDNICRVYFSLSLYNTVSEIENVQVSIRYQTTNTSALDKDKYPSEIMLTSLKTDLNKTTNDKYYIEIKPEDMENGTFTIDQYYQVQLRFTSSDIEDKPSLETPQAIDSWLANNLLSFSEWSTVCLVRGISVPALAIKDFSSGLVEIYSSVANTQIVGRLVFADADENETLRSYRIRLYDNSDTLLLDSDIIYTNKYSDVNSISYTIKRTLDAGEEYYFTIEYETSNLYSNTEEFIFSVIQGPTATLNLQVDAWTDEENGAIGMKINRSRSAGRFTGSIIIRRSSNKDNFTTWEDMYVQNFDHAPYIESIWVDYTIESGVFYWYAVQSIDENGARSPMTKFNAPVMVVFENMFLVSGDKQLVLKYNPQISSFKHTLSESRVETIGSRYPFIKRNGYVDYVQFPISAMISSEMDEEGVFTTKEEVFGDSYDYYTQFNIDNDITAVNDVIYEKRFRDKVIDFLYADDVKLFRSPTEGNLLIRIMDVQFQPNQTLGRRLWSFSGTAYEIDECSLENYSKYNIFTTLGDTIVGSGSGEDASPLAPVRKIVFISSFEEFPTQGNPSTLYVFNQEFYIWNQETKDYDIISVPRWNDEYENVDYSTLQGDSKNLYTNSEDLFVWNNAVEEFEQVSEPRVETIEEG